jgi:hypothetical protein
MTTQTKDSFYLERFKKLAEHPDRYLSKGSSNRTLWDQLSGRKRLEYLTKYEVSDIKFHEQEYLGFQLVIMEHQFDISTALDKTGQPTSDHWLDDADVSGYIDHRTGSLFRAWAWEIGNPVYDAITELNWLDHGTVINSFGGSNSLTKTIKTAQKKLKLLAEVKHVKDVLIQIADDRLNYHEAINPFNVVVGDHVWVDAHGRKRKGVITSTTGSRFNVAYLTPSNHEDLKYKTVGIPNIYVRSNP